TARTSGRPHQFLRARVPLLLLLFDADHNDAARNRIASDELLLPGRRILFVSLIAGIPGRSHFHSHGLCDLLGGVDFSGYFISAAGGWDAVRNARSGAGPVHLSRRLLVRVFPERLYRTCDHYWIDHDVVCSHAGNREDSLERQILTPHAAERVCSSDSRSFGDCSLARRLMRAGST